MHKAHNLVKPITIQQCKYVNLNNLNNYHNNKKYYSYLNMILFFIM